MYDWVYIYEFEGNIRDKIPSLVDEDYIGFWKEADYSFLFFKKGKKNRLEKLHVPFRSELVIRHEDWESGPSLDILNVGRITVHPPWKNPPVEKLLHSIGPAGSRRASHRRKVQKETASPGPARGKPLVHLSF
jgi:hypothetical protein